MLGVGTNEKSASSVELIAARAIDFARRTLDNSLKSKNMFELSYAIKATPANPQALAWIFQAQTRLNDRGVWSQGHFNLAPLDSPRPDARGFPFVCTGRDRIDMEVVNRIGERSWFRNFDVIAEGESAMCNLWDCHLLAAFMLHASERFPELVLSLCDNSCLFIPSGAVLIRAGRMRPDMVWLLSGWEFVSEMSGEAEAIAERVSAQARALCEGKCMVDGPAAEAALRMMIELDLNPNVYERASVGEVAKHVVRDILSDMSPPGGEGSEIGIPRPI